MSKKDLKFGFNNEDKFLDYINTDNEYKWEKFKNKSAPFDFYNNTSFAELKSRRCDSRQYEDTMVGLNKLKICETFPNKNYIFYFLFTDGLYKWDYNFDEYKTRDGGRWDRGRREVKPYGFIHYSHLQLVSDTLTSL